MSPPRGIGCTESFVSRQHLANAGHFLRVCQRSPHGVRGRSIDDHDRWHRLCTLPVILLTRLAANSLLVLLSLSQNLQWVPGIVQGDACGTSTPTPTAPCAKGLVCAHNDGQSTCQPVITQTCLPKSFQTLTPGNRCGQLLERCEEDTVCVNVKGESVCWELDPAAPRVCG